MARLPSPYDNQLPVPRPGEGMVGYRVLSEESLGRIAAETGAAVAGTGRQVAAVGAAVAEGAAGKEAAAERKRRAAGELARAGAGYEEAGGVLRQSAAAKRENASLLAETAAEQRQVGTIFGQAGNEYEQAQSASGKAAGIYGQAANIDENTAAAYRSIGAKTRQDGEAFYEALATEQARLDKVQAEGALDRYINAKIDLTDGEAGYRTVRGTDAVKEGFVKDWVKRLNDQKDAIEGGLANDNQKLEFKRRARMVDMQFGESLLNYARVQGDEVQKERYQGTIDTSVRDASANWNEPATVALALTRVDNAINAQAERLGWPAEMVDALKLKEHGKIHTEIVRKALAEGLPLYAEKWVEMNRGDIDAPTLAAVRKAVEDGNQKQIFNNYTTRYLAINKDPKALAELHQSVMDNAGLDEDRKNVLVNRIQNRMDQLENQAVRQRAQWESSIRRSVDSMNADTFAGFEHKPGDFAGLLAATKGTQFEPEIRQAIALSAATTEFRNSGAQKQAAMITQLEVAAREDPNKFDRRILTAFKTIKESQDKQVKEDPITFAVRQQRVDPQSLAAQPLDLTKPDLVGSQLRERFALARSMVITKNAPFKPLTEDETALLTTALKEMPASQKSVYFGALARSSGDDVQGFKAMMGQIAPDDPVTALAGARAGEAYMARLTGNRTNAALSRRASELMLAGQDIRRPDPKSDGKDPSKGSKWPMPDDTQLDRIFRLEERDAFAGYPTMRRDMVEAAKDIYAKLSADEGDATGSLNSTRWRNAIKLAVGEFYNYNGKSIVLPWGYSPGDFKDGLQTRLRALVDQLPERVSPDMAHMVDMQRLNRQPLENAGDGRYVFRVGDGILVDKNNVPFVIDFNQVVPSGGRPTPTGEPTSTEIEKASRPYRATLPPPRGRIAQPAGQ